MPNIEILLSTYNGAEFLNEQLDSLRRQQIGGLQIRIRDDGSSDGTRAIIEEFEREFLGCKATYEANIGFVRSYFQLLHAADPGCDFFAFCDQDDVWLPEKITRALAELTRRNQDRPLLYFSRLEYVDEKLRAQGLSRLPRRLGFENALVENTATGCTVVFNRKARELFLENPPNEPLWHDWWMYLMVSALGEVIYDEQPTIRYRQHGGNAVGGTSHPIKQLVGRAARFLSGQHKVRIYDQAKEFNACFGASLPHDKRKLLDDLLLARRNFLTRLRYAATMPVWRQSPMDTLFLRLLIVLNRY